MKNYKRVETEKAILGHLIFDNKKVDEIKIIKPYHFSDARNRKLFEAALKLRNENREIDYVSLYEETKIDAAYISSLINYDTFEFLEPILHQSYIRGNIQNYANEILQKNLNEVDVFDEIENLILKLENLTPIQTPNNSEIIQSVIDEIIQDRDSNIERLLKFNSLPSINKYVAGIGDSDLIGIYGKEKSTKTTLAVSMVLDIVLQGKSAAIFSYEINEKEMYQKILSLLTGIPQTKIRNPKGFNADTRLTDSELDELKQQANKLEKLNLSIFSAQQNELDIQSICRSLKKQKGLDLIVIDYLLLVETYKKYSNYRERINDLTRFFKLMANRLHVPIILISQSNESGDRAAEGKGLERDSNYFFYIQSAADLMQRGTKTLKFYDNKIGYYSYTLAKNDYIVQLRKARHTEGNRFFITSYNNGKYGERETKPIYENDDCPV